jgi:hypothetical protein
MDKIQRDGVKLAWAAFDISARPLTVPAIFTYSSHPYGARQFIVVGVLRAPASGAAVIGSRT